MIDIETLQEEIRQKFGKNIMPVNLPHMKGDGRENTPEEEGGVGKSKSYLLQDELSTEWRVAVIR